MGRKLRRQRRVCQRGLARVIVSIERGDGALLQSQYSAPGRRPPRLPTLPSAPGRRLSTWPRNSSGKWAVAVDAMVAASTVPMRAIDAVDPSWRTNCNVPVAVPRRLRGTAFCTGQGVERQRRSQAEANQYDQGQHLPQRRIHAQVVGKAGERSNADAKRGYER